MRLTELFDTDLLDRMLADGYVKATAHPDTPALVLSSDNPQGGFDPPLFILNYTAKCAYDRAWNDVTRQCRGLIARGYGGNAEVVARPWPKFFNYGEHEDGSLDLAAWVEVTDKMDGSLGILHPAPSGGWAIATRGSFTSEQALRATSIWRERYAERLVYGPTSPDLGWTWLFEILYPGNRIVVNYGDLDDLVLLGAVHIETGRTVGPLDIAWSGQSVEVFDAESFAEALAMPPRENAEGIVLRLRDGTMVKVKQDDYVTLHRILTGTNARNVWEVAAVRACAHLIREPKHWGSFLGIDPARAEEVLALGDDWLKDVPDEFYTWVADVYREAEMQAGESFDIAWSLAWDARAVEDRRERYEMVATHPFVKEIMRLASAKTGAENDAAKDQLLLRCWRDACPEPTAPFARTEDVA